MDFMKWINSLDELLYEVVSWLLFFPVTVWRTATRPLTMMAYADQQLSLPEDERYAAAVSPPLFLALSLLVSHGLAVALGQPDQIVANRNGLAGIVDDDASALVLRMVLFAIFPLVTAARLVRRQRLPLDRDALRMPFYAQCYPIAVFSLGLSTGIELAKLPGAIVPAIGGTLIVTSIVYYAVLETRWFARVLAIGRARAAGAMALCLIEGILVFGCVGFMFTR